MKKFRYYISLLFLLFSANTFADDLFSSGNKYYSEEHYKTAAKEYESILDSSELNSEVYYNLGNAYYKSNRIGLAIWAYERALKIDPKNEDAKFNLEFVNLLTEDQIEQPEPAITEWLRRLLFGPNINLWAYISMASSVLFSFVVLLFLISKSRRIRNLSLMGGMLFGLLLGFSTITSWLHKNSLMSDNEAIIISKSAEVRVSPLDKANVSFELHEGSKVNILQQNDAWLQIEVNGNTGWIFIEDLKKI